MTRCADEWEGPRQQHLETAGFGNHPCCPKTRLLKEEHGRATASRTAACAEGLDERLPPARRSSAAMVCRQRQ